jgi:mxaJ protein
MLLWPAAAGAGDLRFCADPNNMPYSNARGEGFENRIAAIVAKDMGLDVAYAWHAQRRGFLRETLNAGLCSVVAGVPVGLHGIKVTRPYYRSGYVFLQRAEAAPVYSFSDPRLATLRLGVQLIGDDGSNTPPVHVLAQHGIVGNVRGFMVYGDYADENPAMPLVSAVADGTVDVGIMWGPTAGYFAALSSVPLSLTLAPSDAAGGLILPMTFDIAMGVRKADVDLRNRIGEALARHRAEIDAILAAYGVPRLDRTGKEATR